MNLAKISAAALIVAALASTGAMAATTTTKVVTKTTAMAHTMAKPAPVKQVVTPATVFAKGKAAGVATVAEIAAGLASFDRAALTAFDGAKTVTVYYYNKAWTGADKVKAEALLKTDSKSIAALRAAIAKDPKAEALLKAHHIHANRVVGIFDVKGAVSLYIL